jgi:hypothetical protein
MYKIVFLLSMCCCIVNLQAQVTLNVTGNAINTTNGSHSYSIGEMVLVHTAQAGKYIITQGLLQPSNATINSATTSVLQATVYPIPTSDNVSIKSYLADATSITYTLTDAQGKILLQQNIAQPKQVQLHTINMASYAAGNYYLQLHTGNFKSNFKIQKQ